MDKESYQKGFDEGRIIGRNDPRPELESRVEALQVECERLRVFLAEAQSVTDSVTLYRRVEALQAEVAKLKRAIESWKREEEIWHECRTKAQAEIEQLREANANLQQKLVLARELENDDAATCLVCGSDMQLVRPGKWQCGKCELDEMLAAERAAGYAAGVQAERERLSAKIGSVKELGKSVCFGFWEGTGMLNTLSIAIGELEDSAINYGYYNGKEFSEHGLAEARVAVFEAIQAIAAAIRAAGGEGE